MIHYCVGEEKWPDKVPVLTARDIFQGDYSNEDATKHRLLGWRDEVFTYPATVTVCQDMEKFIPEGADIAEWNDTHSKKEVARLWNRAMASLGYTEGNPERIEEAPSPR